MHGSLSFPTELRLLDAPLLLAAMGITATEADCAATLMLDSIAAFRAFFDFHLGPGIPGELLQGNTGPRQVFFQGFGNGIGAGGDIDAGAAYASGAADAP